MYCIVMVSEVSEFIAMNFNEIAFVFIKSVV